MLRAKVGMVFQKPTPFPMTIYENIAFGVRLYEQPTKANLDARVEDALRRGAIWDEVSERSARGVNWMLKLPMFCMAGPGSPAIGRLRHPLTQEEGPGSPAAGRLRHPLGRRSGTPKAKETRRRR